MQGREHSVIREGTIVGILGAVVDAFWLLVFDVATGRPLQTPNALGRVFFAGDACTTDTFGEIRGAWASGGEAARRVMALLAPATGAR